MTVQSFEVGLVSGDRRLVDFLVAVFQLDELAATESRVGTIHRLQSPGAVIKVMVPSEPPADADRRSFLAAKGLRYLTLSVTDLDQVTERCVAHGGSLLVKPFHLTADTRLAVITDTDGNTMEITETA